jgi:hypothetical protein
MQYIGSTDTKELRKLRILRMRPSFALIEPCLFVLHDMILAGLQTVEGFHASVRMIGVHTHI